MFFPSHRNNIESHLDLLDQVGTRSFLVPCTNEPRFIKEVEERIAIKRYTLPSLTAILDDSTAPDFPFHRSFEAMRLEPWLILHTSGSTGSPKMMVLKHGYPTTVDSLWLSEKNEMFDRLGNMRIFAPFPAFHVGGIIYSLMSNIFNDSTVVLPPPVPLTAALIDSVHRVARVDASSIPPSLIVDLAKDDAFLRNLKRLKSLTYAGGPLPKPTGDMLCEHLSLLTVLGATEYGTIPLRPKASGDWEYFHFDVEYGGLEFRDSGREGVFELVIVRRPGLHLSQAVFVTFPDKDEYATKDCFSPHASKSGLWKYEGRLDDVIVLNNGEKLNPVTMEGMLTSHPDISGCLVVGLGRFQAAMLLETTLPPITAAERSMAMQKIWPTIERANASMVSHGRVSRNLVAFLPPDKVFPRAPKGTIQRYRANCMFRDEIDALYRDIERADKPEQVHPVSIPETDSSYFIKTVLMQELGVGELSEHDNVFDQGMDSLIVLSTVRRLNQSAAKYGFRAVEPKDIYENPTFEEIIQVLTRQELHRRNSEEEDRESWDRMEKVFQENIAGFPDIQSDSPRRYCSLLFRQTRWMIPPDGGALAWLQVLGSFLINMNNWGLANSWGVLQSFLEANTLSEYSPAAISWIGTLQASLILILGVLSGPLFDLGHFKSVLIVSTIALVLALMFLSLSTQYYQIMLTWGVVGGICSGLLYIPSIALLPSYFTSKRSRAIGIATSGGSLGGIIYPVVIRRLLNTGGFGWACRCVGFISLATLAASIVIVQPVAQRRKPIRHLFDASMFSDPPYLTFMVAAFFLFAGYLVPFVLTPSFAERELQQSRGQSLYLLAIPNGTQLVGRVISGLLAETIGPEWMLFSAQVLAALLCLCWITIRTLPSFIAFLCFYGFASGLIATLPAAVVPYVCPSLAVLGTRMGMIYASAGVGALIGTPVALAANGVWPEKGFAASSIWAGLTFFVGAACFLFTGVEAHRRRVVIDAGQKTRLGLV